MFYRKLGDGRTFAVFRNSMKNVRDYFDSHINSGRVGWRAKGSEGGENRPPRPLSKQTKDVIDAWKSRSDEELWEAVRQYADQGVQFVGDAILSDLAAELDPERTVILAKTEGGRKVVVSIRVERDPSLRAAAISLHGTKCAVCGFCFFEMYGSWGDGFVVVHHLVPFGTGGPAERPTNPATDLVVVCANCHCMIHRKKNTALTVDELKTKLRCTFRSGFPASNATPG
jgi:predicted HNH restriction endonuclease